MADLEPDIFLGQWRGRRVDYILEALETKLDKLKSTRMTPGTYLEGLVVFLLLLVDYSESEVNLVGLVKIGLHLHDLREGLLCMVQRAITVI